MINALFEVQIPGGKDLPGLADLYKPRDDQAKQSGFPAPDGQAARLMEGDPADWVVGATSAGLLVAVPGGQPV